MQYLRPVPRNEPMKDIPKDIANRYQPQYVHPTNDIHLEDVSTLTNSSIYTCITQIRLFKFNRVPWFQIMQRRVVSNAMRIPVMQSKPLSPIPLQNGHLVLWSRISSCLISGFAHARNLISAKHWAQIYFEMRSLKSEVAPIFDESISCAISFQRWPGGSNALL